MIKTIGFIGLGIMGKPMSKNLLRAGYSLVVHDVNREAVKELVNAGAREVFSPRQVSEAADAVITMLPGDPEVEQVLTGRDGLMEGARKGLILADMSTISPTTARRVAEELENRGLEMLDAPVSGGEVGAKEASLSIMVGGKAEVFERMILLFQRMGKNVNHVGDHGAGQVAKAANQIIVGLNIEAVAEALIFVKKAGVDPEKVREALMGGFAQSRVLEVHGKRMTDRHFKPGAKVSIHKKDTEIVMTVARDLSLCLPGTALVSHLWNAVAAQGGLDWDHSSMVKVLEMLSGTEL